MKNKFWKPAILILSLIWPGAALVLPLNAKADPGNVLLGDSNCDGIVNVMDVITTVNHILGNNPEPFCFENADVNDDGSVNVMDVIETVNIILGGSTFECGVSTITDADNNVYNTVLIGNQCWMKENLKTTKYHNGTDIPNVTNASDWVNLTTGAYCWFANSFSWKDYYGALYNWYATDPASNGNNQLCPEGWKVPTDEDYTILSTYLGGTVQAGGKMKSTRTDPDPHPRWLAPNTGATNESEFTALPGGYRAWNGGFSDMGTYCWLWTSSTQQTIFGYLRNLRHNSGILARGSINKHHGLSVRCVKDVSGN
jgi:uncharacterized protein (TIGR02145 family)